MKRRILLLMMTALLSVGAWATDDLTLNVGGIGQFDGYGLSNQSGSSFTVENWATVGWTFDTALSQDDYYGVEFTVTASTANAKLKIIYDETYTYTDNNEEKTANYEQIIDIPSGTSTIVTHFSYNYNIKKIGFREHSTESTEITVTSAVVKAWGNDIPLNVATTTNFSDWGFSYSDNTITVSRYAPGGGWQFAHPISNTLYSGIDLTFSELAKKMTLRITYANSTECSYEIPEGSTHIAVGFDVDSNISKIGFYHGDNDNSNNVSITITSAVLLSSTTGDEVDVKDAASITVSQWNYNTYKTFDSAINIDDYEKVVFTFSSDIPEDALSLQAKIKDGDAKSIGSLIKNGSKVTGYFSNMSSATIESLGFHLGWNSASTSSVTLSIASAKLYKKASAETPTEPTTPDTENELVKDENQPDDTNDAHTEVYTLGTQSLTVSVEKTEDSGNSGTYKTNGTISASATTTGNVTTVTLTPAPAEGYNLSKLIIEETADAGSGDARKKAPAVAKIIQATKQDNGTWTFKMPESSVIISATFAEKPQKPTLAYNQATRTITITNTEYEAGNNVTATLHYTLNNGVEQTTTDASVTTEAITVNTTVTAWIVSTETVSSDNAEATFKVAAKPTVAYTDGENTVSLSLTEDTGTNTADKELYYTTDGTPPTTESTQQTANGTINITEGMTTIKVLALDADGNYSEIVEQTVAYAYYLTASKEWTTYYNNYSKTFSVPDGLKAYTVTSVTAPANGQSGNITIAEQTVIAKNTPMLIYNENASNTDKYRVYTTTDQTISGTASEFKGVDADYDIPNDGKARYILVDGVFTRTVSGTLPAHRCYLELNASSTQATARHFIIGIGGGDGTTGIQTIDNGKLTIDNCYDLQGRRVAQPTKGLYIVNGKKVVIR